MDQVASCSIRRGPLKQLAIAALIVVLVLGLGRPTLAANGSLVLAALQVLQRNYVEQVPPATLLNVAVGSLRAATGLNESALPPILETASPQEAATAFAAAFESAARTGKVAETQLAYVATQTMLASLHDSHTYYMPPAAWQEYRRRLTGNPGVTGIGVSISARMDASGIRWIFVEDVFPGSPAESAGIKRFDRIVQVGATPLRNATAEQASELLRGVAGSVADVTVQRGDQTLKIAVSRAAYQIKSVDAKFIEPGVAYVHLYDFRDRGANDVSAALSRLNAQTPLRAIVLDLRGNSGGLLAEAAALASLFLPPGTPLAKVTERNATGMLQSAGAPPFGTVPLALLVDGRSASASEIVTGALKDTRRATIVGERTAGALGGALTVALPEGGMSVTALRIVTPSGAQVEGVGIAPHTQVNLTESDMERGEDTQLRAALQALIALRTAHLVLAA